MLKIYEEAKCNRGIVHDFKSLKNTPVVVVEVCVLCSKKEIYNKDKDGRIHKARYARTHQRDTAQPFNKNAQLFEKLYGHKGIIELYNEFRNKKNKEQISLDWEDMRRNIVSRAKKTK